MPFIGPKPADTILDSTLITDGSITSAKIADGTIVNADLNSSAAIATSKITGLAASATTDTTNAANIASGVIADARISASSVQQHATSFDDNKLVNDISTLAIRQASNENKSAYNTNSMYVDVFQDSTGYTNGASTERNAGEYVSSITGGSLTGSFTNMSSSNFSSQGNWSWSSGGSGNSLTMGSSPDNDTGSHTGQGSSAITFGANRPFQFKAGPTYNASSYGPYWGFRKTTNSGAVQGQGGDLDDEGEFYYRHGSADNNGIYANDGAGDGNETRKYTNVNNSGQYVGVERTAGGIYKLHWNTSAIDFTDSSTIRYTFTNAYTGAYYFVISGQGGHRSDLDNLQYDIGSEQSVSATGNFTCPNITASASVSKMGAIITYQDIAGTNALNTDIVLQLSADGGSNYATATMTAMPDFATGIKMAKVNDLSVTAGTSLKYKISFANQASGSKEARIRGVSLQY